MSETQAITLIPLRKTTSPRLDRVLAYDEIKECAGTSELNFFKDVFHAKALLSLSKEEQRTSNKSLDVCRMIAVSFSIMLSIAMV